LDDVGLPFEQGEGLALFGWRGRRRRETAEFVIRRRHIGSYANDLGFHRLDDGSFEAVISEYDRRGRGQEILDQVKQRYAYQAVCQKAQAKGYTVVEQPGDDGVIRLQLRAY
jgi:hypothetical protein